VAQENKFTVYETTGGRELIGSTDVFGEATAAIMRRVALDPSVPADMADRRRMETPGEVWHFTDAGRTFEVIHVKDNPAMQALRHHVSGAVERGEAEPVVAQETTPGIDLNDDGEVIATAVSMEHYAAQEHPGRLIAWSPLGESYSADVGDYFGAGEPGEALVDSEGEEMVLAYVMPERVEPIKLDAPETTVTVDGEFTAEQVAAGFKVALEMGAYLSERHEWDSDDVLDLLTAKLREAGMAVS
jgi:hypothetical protein